MVNSDRAPCTKLHKVEQKDRTKTLAEFPDHILNDYVYIQHTFVQTCKSSTAKWVAKKQCVWWLLGRERIRCLKG